MLTKDANPLTCLGERCSQVARNQDGLRMEGARKLWEEADAYGHVAPLQVRVQSVEAHHVRALTWRAVSLRRLTSCPAVCAPASATSPGSVRATPAGPRLATYSCILRVSVSQL